MLKKKNFFSKRRVGRRLEKTHLFFQYISNFIVKKLKNEVLQNESFFSKRRRN